jgi:hypothetical protein
LKFYSLLRPGRKETRTETHLARILSNPDGRAKGIVKISDVCDETLGRNIVIVNCDEIDLFFCEERP